MTRFTAARALAGVCLLAMPAAAAAQLPGSSTVLGGYRPAATDSPMIQEAAAVLAAHVGGELASVDAAESSSAPAVRLQITLADGARWSGVLGFRFPERRYVVSGEPLQLSPPPGEGDEVDTGSNQAPEDEDE